MSIVVAVRVGEGLVFAADSASTLSVRTSQGEGVAKVFNHSTKLLQLADYPIAVASWGAGNIGARTISSVIEEFANERQPNKEVADSLAVETEARELQKHLLKVYEQDYPDWKQSRNTPGLGALVGGYSGKGFFPEEYAFSIPVSDFSPLRVAEPGSPQDFGANWYGMTDAIVRLHHGRDDSLPAILKAEEVDDAVIERVMNRLRTEVQYPVLFGGMPIQDAVDYAMYTVGVVVGRFRFVAGPEVCGGPIDVAAITRKDGFKWVQKKELAARPFGPQI